MNKNRLFFFIQRLIGNSTFIITPRLRGWIYSFFFKSVGSNFSVYESVIIKYPDQIEIGANLILNQGCYIVGKGGLKIGNNVMIGAGTKICTTTHNYHSIETPMLYQGIETQKIVIEDDVWLGFNVIVLQGVTIKKSSIVGAATLVNKDINEFEIVAGIPNKLVKSRI